MDISYYYLMEYIRKLYINNDDKSIEHIRQVYNIVITEFQQFSILERLI